MAAHILIIEDNAANLALVEYLLRAAGYRITAATDGGEGLRAAMAEPPDLIVSDLQMPVLDGYEVLRKLREEPLTRTIPVVAVTAFSAPGDQLRVLEAGFNGYLSKPIDPESFVHQIECYLPTGILSAAARDRG